MAVNTGVQKNGWLSYKKAREFIEQWTCCEVKKKGDDNGDCRSLL